MRAFPLIFSTVMLLSVEVCSEKAQKPAFIVSNEPVDGTTGVRSDVHIVLTFNQAVDHTKGESAYESADVGLRPQDVTFQWSGDSKMLTIVPNAPLVYSSGAFPVSVAPKLYTYRFDSRPIDDQPVYLEAKFKTLRKVTKTGAPCGVFYNYTSSGPVVGIAEITAGDDAGNNQIVSAFDVPVPAVALGTNGSILAATLRVQQRTTTGAPYSTLGNAGAMDELQHVVFNTTSGSDVFTTSTLDTPAQVLFSGPGTAAFANVDVTTDVAADWTAGIVDWRIAFANATDSDATADQQGYGNCDPASGTGPTLDVTWTQP